MAAADGDLAPRTAAELLADLQRARLDQLSGTVVQTADLGLPQLPGMGGSGEMGGASGAELSSVVSGSHTWKVWYGGEDRQRLALIGTLGESDVIRNGKDVWIWSSRAQTATHLVRDTTKPSSAPMFTNGPTGTGLPATPEEAARAALAAIDPTTKAEVGPAVVVAGRTAYELVLTPKDSATLVAQVRLAVDGERRLPLRVQVFSTKQANPAVEVGFTAIDFSAPEARQFEFTPPPGTTVTEASDGDGPGRPHATASPTRPTGSSGPGAATGDRTMRTVGTGWSRIVVAALPAGLLETDASSGGGAGGAKPSAGPGTSGTSGAGGAAGQVQSLLAALPKVSGAWGSGRVLEGTLFSVVLTDDGRIALGAVAPEALYAALAAPAPMPVG